MLKRRRTIVDSDSEDDTYCHPLYRTNDSDACASATTFTSVSSPCLSVTDSWLSLSNKNFVCEIEGCGHSCVTKVAINAHRRRTHNIIKKRGTKPKGDKYQCDKCEGTFGTIQGLSQHRIRTHKVVPNTVQVIV